MATIFTVGNSFSSVTWLFQYFTSLTITNIETTADKLPAIYNDKYAWKKWAVEAFFSVELTAFKATAFARAHIFHSQQGEPQMSYKDAWAMFIAVDPPIVLKKLSSGDIKLIKILVQGKHDRL